MKLPVMIFNLWSLHGSVIPDTSWRWENCLLRKAGFTNDSPKVDAVAVTRVLE